MGQLDKLETALNEVFNKKAPVKIPPEGRKSLAGALWWLALGFGLLELWAVWGLWNLGHLDKYMDYANSLSAAYGGGEVAVSLGFFYYVALLVAGASAVLSLLAAPGLKAMRKAGWNLLFYSLLLNAAYGVVALFSTYGGVSDLLWALLSSAIGAYLLFQVRDNFMKSQPAGHKK